MVHSCHKVVNLLGACRPGDWTFEDLMQYPGFVSGTDDRNMSWKELYEAKLKIYPSYKQLGGSLGVGWGLDCKTA